jgi:hypothetical protein
MIKPIELTEQDKALMTQYNIKAETRMVFHARGYKYDKLKDALSFARQALQPERRADNE